jgi:hypothetical protein
MYCGGVKNDGSGGTEGYPEITKISLGVATEDWKKAVAVERKVYSMSEAEGETKDKDFGDVAAMVDEVRRSMVAT